MNGFFTTLMICLLLLLNELSLYGQLVVYDPYIANCKVSEKLHNALSRRENSIIIGVSKNQELLLDELMFLVAALSVKYSNHSYADISDIFLKTMRSCREFYINKLVMVSSQFIDALKKIPQDMRDQKIEFLVEIFMDSSVTAGYFIILKNVLEKQNVNLFCLDQYSLDQIKASIKLFFEERLANFDNKLSQIQKYHNDSFKFIIFNEYFFSKTPLHSDGIEILNKIMSFLKSSNILVIYNILTISNNSSTAYERDNFIKLFLQRDVVFYHGIGDFYTKYFVRNKAFTSILRNYTLFSINGVDVAVYFKGSYYKEHDASMLSGSCFAFGDYKIHSLDDHNVIGRTIRDYCCSRICLDNQSESQIAHNHDEKKLFSFIQSNTLNCKSISAGCESDLYVICDALHGTNVFINQVGNGIKEVQITDTQTIKRIDFEKHLKKDTISDILDSVKEDVILLLQEDTL